MAPHNYRGACCVADSATLWKNLSQMADRSTTTMPAADARLRDHRRAPGRGARRRPRRPDRRLPARQAGQAGDRARVDRPGRRDRAHRGPRRLPLRPRRPPLLHEGQGGRRPLARDHGGRVPQAPAPEPDLLERQVPRVPARGHGRDQASSAPSSWSAAGSPTCGRRSSRRAARRRFEEWVSNRFGKRLYNHFFKTYTEKLWGVSTAEIRAEWAAQRIKGLSFFSAAKAAFFGNKGNKIKSLISEFNYPRYGPGQMWEQMTDEIRAHGGEVRLNAPVTRLRIDDGRVVEVIAGGETLTPSHVISSLPLRTTVGIAEPEAPAEVRDAARGLRYREFLTVLLVIEGEDLFPDNWIYIHQPGVRVLPDPELQVLEPVDGARGRPTPRSGWSTSASRATTCGHGRRRPRRDGRREIEKLHLAQGREGQVRVRRPRPQGVPDLRRRVRRAGRRRSAAGSTTIANLTQVGRNGLHRYNNSDHSMLTAMRAVDNILLGTHHDIWAVNAESVYHEEHVRRTSSRTARRPRRRRWSSRSPRSASGARRGAPPAAVLIALLLGGRRARSRRGGDSRRRRHARRCRARPARSPRAAAADADRPRRPRRSTTTTTTSSTDSGLSGGERDRDRDRRDRACSAGSRSSSGATRGAARRSVRPPRRAGVDGRCRAGSKARAKPRKLSPAERRRRKRGRAR